MASFYSGLAARGMLVMFDRRGTGLSDKVSGERLPTLDAKMDDIRAVMDAVDVERVVLFGIEDGAAHCFLFAAIYPSGRKPGDLGRRATLPRPGGAGTPLGDTEEQFEQEIDQARRGGNPRLQ